MTNEDKKGFRFTVNGIGYETRDQIEEGRKLLQQAGFEPAGDFVLIQLNRPGTQSIGLDEEVDLDGHGQKEFRAFKSDRTFNFIAIERGYEWGAPNISDAELRDITGIAASEVLVLERIDAPDKEIEAGESVDLAAPGTEHISKRARRITIIVNAREETVETDYLTYAQLLALAFHPVPIGPDVAFTITYRNGPQENPKGTLPEGAGIAIKNRMIFNVTQTNRS